MCNKCLFRNFFFCQQELFFLLPAHSTSDLFLSRSVTTPANWPKMSLGSYLINSRRMEAERALIPAFFEGGNIIAIETLVTSSHQRPTQNKVPIIFPCLIFSPVIFLHSAIPYSFRNFDYNFKCLLWDSNDVESVFWRVVNHSTFLKEFAARFTERRKQTPFLKPFP